MSARMRLRRGDGRVYLNRWGIESKRFGGIFIHKMEAPDPGVDLHDHPWTFWSLILKGGYLEQRCSVRDASLFAKCADDGFGERGYVVRRRPFSFKSMRLDECHRIFQLEDKTCWTVVIHGPSRRKWGFYEPDGFVLSRQYGTDRRDMWEEIQNAHV